MGRRVSGAAAALDAGEERVAALRALVLPIAQSAIAASLAWYLAHDIIGHRNAFFAPIATLIALGVGASNRLNLPPEVPAAIRQFAAGVRAVEHALEGRDRSEAVDAVIQAAVLADRGLERDPALSAAHLVGQVRSMATDLLRAPAPDRADAVARIRRA